MSRDFFFDYRLVYGTDQLVDYPRQHDQLDEHRLMLFLVVPGSGKPLFSSGSDLTDMKLVSSHTTGTRVVVLTYQPVSAA